MIDFLDKIYEKTVKTLYKPDKKKIKIFLEKLDELRIIRDGGVIISLQDGGKLTMHTGHVISGSPS